MNSFCCLPAEQVDWCWLMLICVYVWSVCLFLCWNAYIRSQHQTTLCLRIGQNGCNKVLKSWRVWYVWILWCKMHSQVHLHRRFSSISRGTINCVLCVLCFFSTVRNLKRFRTRVSEILCRETSIFLSQLNCNTVVWLSVCVWRMMLSTYSSTELQCWEHSINWLWLLMLVISCCAIGRAYVLCPAVFAVACISLIALCVVCVWNPMMKLNICYSRQLNRWNDDYLTTKIAEDLQCWVMCAMPVWHVCFENDDTTFC